MSCGNPHEMDCADALAKVYLYLDGEMADADCTELRHHLEECAPCLREFGLEQHFKALVTRSCGCDEAPADMKERLLVRLREVRVELTHVEYRPE